MSKTDLTNTSVAQAIASFRKGTSPNPEVRELVRSALRSRIVNPVDFLAGQEREWFELGRAICEISLDSFPPCEKLTKATSIYQRDDEIFLNVVRGLKFIKTRLGLHAKKTVFSRLSELATTLTGTDGKLTKHSSAKKHTLPSTSMTRKQRAKRRNRNKGCSSDEDEDDEDEDGEEEEDDEEAEESDENNRKDEVKRECVEKKEAAVETEEFQEPFRIKEEIEEKNDLPCLPQQNFSTAPKTLAEVMSAALAPETFTPDALNNSTTLNNVLFGKSDLLNGVLPSTSQILSPNFQLPSLDLLPPAQHQRLSILGRKRGNMSPNNVAQMTIAETILNYPRAIFSWGDVLEDSSSSVGSYSMRWVKSTFYTLESKSMIKAAQGFSIHRLATDTVFIKETRVNSLPSFAEYKINPNTHMLNIFGKPHLRVKGWKPLLEQLMHYDELATVSMDSLNFKMIANVMCLGILQLDKEVIQPSDVLVKNLTMMEHVFAQLQADGLLIPEDTTSSNQLNWKFRKYIGPDLNDRLQKYGIDESFLIMSKDSSMKKVSELNLGRDSTAQISVHIKETGIVLNNLMRHNGENSVEGEILFKKLKIDTPLVDQVAEIDIKQEVED